MFGAEFCVQGTVMFRVFDFRGRATRGEYITATLLHAPMLLFVVLGLNGVLLVTVMLPDLQAEVSAELSRGGPILFERPETSWLETLTGTFSFSRPTVGTSSGPAWVSVIALASGLLLFTVSLATTVRRGRDAGLTGWGGAGLFMVPVWAWGASGGVTFSALLTMFAVWLVLASMPSAQRAEPWDPLGPNPDLAPPSGPQETRPARPSAAVQDVRRSRVWLSGNR